METAHCPPIAHGTVWFGTSSFFFFKCAFLEGCALIFDHCEAQAMMCTALPSMWREGQRVSTK